MMAAMDEFLNSVTDSKGFCIKTCGLLEMSSVVTKLDANTWKFLVVGGVIGFFLFVLFVLCLIVLVQQIMINTTKLRQIREQTKDGYSRFPDSGVTAD